MILERLTFYPDGTLQRIWAGRNGFDSDYFIREYDEHGTLRYEETSDSIGDTDRLWYDEHGNLFEWADEDGIGTCTNRYDDHGNHISGGCYHPYRHSAVSTSYHYQYDECGNILEIEFDRESTDSDCIGCDAPERFFRRETSSFVYDEHGHVIEYQHDSDGDGRVDTHWMEIYDPSGRRRIERMEIDPYGAVKRHELYRYGVLGRLMLTEIDHDGDGDVDERNRAVLDECGVTVVTEWDGHIRDQHITRWVLQDRKGRPLIEEWHIGIDGSVFKRDLHVRDAEGNPLLFEQHSRDAGIAPRERWSYTCWTRSATGSPVYVGPPVPSLPLQCDWSNGADPRLMDDLVEGLVPPMLAEPSVRPPPAEALCSQEKVPQVCAPFDGPHCAHWRGVEASRGQTCAIRDTGALVCVGPDDFGRPQPPRWHRGPYAEAAPGRHHTCARLEDGHVSCWGWRHFGQCDSPEMPLAQITVGGYHSCGIDLAGQLLCWGANWFGQADPPTGHYLQVSAGLLHTCALDVDGSVRCWGLDADGRIDAPEGIFAQVSAGGDRTCAVRDDGQGICWGEPFGQPSPQHDRPFRSISVGHEHACGILRETGAIRCWGRDAEGQSTPPPGRFRHISAGGGHTCALDEEGTVQCWGRAPVGWHRPAADRPEAEVCDGVDNDCDLFVDEGLSQTGTPCETGLPGTCAHGIQRCREGRWVCEMASTLPGMEICNGVDDDCNGVIDEQDPQGGGPCVTQTVGVCAEGIWRCTDGQITCVQTHFPAPEICDGLDNDCNGASDDRLEDCCIPETVEACRSPLRAYRPGIRICDGDGRWGGCFRDAPRSERETCNGVDDDFDDYIDDIYVETTCGLGVCAHALPACVDGHPPMCDAYAGSSDEICDGVDNDSKMVLDS